MKSPFQFSGMIPFILTVALYVAAVAGFAVWSYLDERSSALADIDNRLLIGNSALMHILPPDFHDRATDSGSITPEEDMRNLEALTAFTSQAGFMYAYTVIRVGNTVYFTSSNASDEEMKAKDFLKYFTRYDEASPTFRSAFDSAVPVFTTYTDRWGRVRSALVRHHSPGGRVYVTGVDYKINYIAEVLRRKLLNSLGIAVLLLLASLPVFIMFYRRERKNARQLREAQETLLADVAQRLSTESALRESEQQLHQAQKMESVGRLAGGVAHDFNNMLTGIMGTTELLLQQFENNKQVAEDLKLILYAGSKAADLTRNLLDFSHKGKQLSTPFDVHDSIHSAIELLKRSVDKRIAISGDLQARPSVVSGDPSQILNAFVNLGVNARDAMPDGGTLVFSTRTVIFTPDSIPPAHAGLAPGRYLSIRISDTGTGIAPQDLPRIFEPFFTTKAQGKGTGLGLAAVYGAVRDHHGSITVQSNPDRGTALTILLPAAEVNLPAAPRAPAVHRPAHEHILVVDDEPVVRRSIHLLLEKLGYRVSVAETGTRAVELYRRDWPSINLVILDMMMPDMNGRECFHHLRAVNPQARVLICSGYSEQTNFGDLLNEGAAGYLKKPFGFDELKEILEKAFRDGMRR